MFGICTIGNWVGGTRVGGVNRTVNRLVATAAVALVMLGSFAVSAHAEDVRYFGSAGDAHLNQPIVGIAATPTGHGYWLAASDGGIFAFGDATFLGSTGALHLNSPIVAITATPSGHGYWLAARDGGIFAFGDAAFSGSTGALRLNSPIVGMAATPSGHGYWLVARDGGIFAFGDATFVGSTGAVHLNSPIVAMAATASGHGYLLVAADGGIFAFGDATFAGSAGGLALGTSVVGITMNPMGPGYWLVTANGGVFAYGGASLYSQSGAGAPQGWITGMAAATNDAGYWLVNAGGGVFTFAPEHRTYTDSLRATADGTSAIARDLFVRINAERAARGLDPLAWDTRLADRAGSWSSQMPVVGFRHQDLSGLLNGPDFAGRYSHLGENIYSGWGAFADSGHAHAGSVGFMNSGEHRANILQPGLTTIGIGAYCAPDGGLWVTEDFGSWNNWRTPGWDSGTPSTPPIAKPDLASPHC
jgi:uncharacterized protein YkwD